MADETSGFPSRELGTNYITKRAGSNQNLTHDAAHHPDIPRLAPNANRVQSGQLPRTSGPVIGSPDAVNPVGRGYSDTLEGR